MQALNLTDNSKTKFKKNHYNTFALNYGLPEYGGTCPGATSGNGGCLALKRIGGKVSTCYMDKLARAYPSLSKSLQKNTDLLKGKSVDEMEGILTATIQLFLKKSGDTDLYFRISTSGDFFSEDYARAWARVINKYPQIQFWTYTRSFWAVKFLIECGNLALYLSADPVNYEQVVREFVLYRGAGYNNIGLSFMGVPDNIDKLKDTRWVTCPEISGKVKNLPNSGACSRCRLCFTYSKRLGLRNIRFPIH